MNSRSATLIDISEIPYGKKKDPTKYLYQPPSIKPNLGKLKKTVLPDTHVCKVILYDNTMQRRMLDVKRDYFEHEQHRFHGIIEKNRHAFADREQTRRKLHDGWTSRYNIMKNAYISRYGTQYMPTAEEDDAEEYKIFTYAMMAAPINIVCFFLASGNDPRQKEKERRARLRKQLQNLARDPLGEYLKRRRHPIGKSPPIDPNKNKICSKDPRFHSLTESLIKHDQSDGYLQLSPGYAKDIGHVNRHVATKQREVITLPTFYARNNMVRQSSSCSQLENDGENSSMEIYEDERTSVSSLT